MITLERQRSWLERHLGETAMQSHQPPPSWLAEARQQARQNAMQQPLHGRHHESWRYSSIEGLLRQDFSLSRQEHALHTDRADDTRLAGLDSYRVVMVNGSYSPGLSKIGELPQGARLVGLDEALSSVPELLAAWFAARPSAEGSIFSALNTALGSDGFVLYLEPHVRLQHPVEVVHLNLGAEQQLMMSPRNLVVLQTGAEATLVERFIGDSPAVYFHNSHTQINLQQDAVLRHYRLQQESLAAWHLSSLSISQQSRSDYRGATLAFGGGWSRTEYQLDLAERHASCSLDGLYMVGDRQFTDFHLKIRHRAAACESREHFKGILHGEGRAVFDGHILVDRDAQHSDAQLSNDNIMLTRNAEIDTKPQLEIYADDVKCSHGTTVGQLDPQQLFYMRSRGIGATAARAMLCRGFAAEIIDGIAPEALRAHAALLLDSSLEGALRSAGGN
jgi:Fe-S cluster assembly protein SufD